MFLSKIKKGYTFLYRIHSDGDLRNESEYCVDPAICWSLFVKIGRVTHTIWKFHRFSQKIIEIVYKQSKASKENNSTFLEDCKGSNPINKLAQYLEIVCKQVADMIFKEADEI
jgi:hypothetical protein